MSAVSIPVCLPDTPYDIAIASSSLTQLGCAMVERGLSQKVLVVSNPVIFKHYGRAVLDGLGKADFMPSTCILPAGERYKTLRSVQKIYDAALAAGLERSSTIVALGGGVIGDMAGFAAATWLRGIQVVQVPTTLLAMVDAAIGGKTGVNHPQGKNLIGAFKQPRLVWIDPDVLATLPPREFRAAMAEVIKYGVIRMPELFEYLENLSQLASFRSFDAAALFHAIEQSARCKADVVVQDEKEGGLRAVLNYGHTVGHAIESATHYRRYRHGEGVALGMEAAARIASNLGWWERGNGDRQRDLMERCGLPVRLPAEIDRDRVVALTHSDKKVKSGKVRFVLPRAIGRVEITDAVGDGDVLQVLEAMQA
ncbi:3-dehydroquinate synthase [Synechococcus sp. PCC 7336]|uniref:3-dehydroquinate synthase n=1 Tax=Synechococcus sp. PCC 7336 TaxID=195250 RepID=UPI000477DEBC|nr:3-dehydroquinate synthase [Synechococcus sp. PCC 7336]